MNKDFNSKLSIKFKNLSNAVLYPLTLYNEVEKFVLHSSVLHETFTGLTKNLKTW